MVAMGHTGFGSGRRVALSALCLTIVVIAAGFYWYATQGPSPAHAARSPAVPGVPVSIAVAAQQDVPIYLTGLGTAGFLYRRHPLAGRWQVAGGVFTEGQHVKKGDLLAQIDPRLFQAALDQAAKKAQDLALLVSAQKTSSASRAWCSKTSKASRTSIASRGLWISSKPRSMPMPP